MSCIFGSPRSWMITSIDTENIGKRPESVLSSAQKPRSSRVAGRQQRCLSLERKIHKREKGLTDTKALRLRDDLAREYNSLAYVLLLLRV